MKYITVTSLLLLIQSQLLASIFISKKIEADEHVIFFPALAHHDKAKNQWVVNIHGWIFEPDPAANLKLFATHLFGKTEYTEQDYFKQLMNKRLQWFFVDNESNKIISIRLHDKIYKLNKSKANGHFYGRLRINDKVYKTLPLDHNDRITFQALLPKNDRRKFYGSIQFLSPTGLSIVSDIDDTIKISAVSNKKELLKNTFSRPFRPIPGMAESYQNWAKTQKVSFHYVTSSPWQLYIPLKKFMQKYKFPNGSFHMKYFRLNDKTVINIFKSSKEYKIKEITRLIKRFPQRQFIFVGDSSEHDLAIYTKLANKFPNKVRAIYIHEVKEKPIASNIKTRLQNKIKNYSITIFNKLSTPLPLY